MDNPHLHPEREAGILFDDRRDAGRQLAHALLQLPGVFQPGPPPSLPPLVLALPRGGVPVAYEVARALRLPLDILIVRKLGVPGQEELALGAVSGSGLVVLQPDVVRALHIPQSLIDAIVRHERLEIDRRDAAYREGRPPAAIHGRSVLLVDDGLATGSTMTAAVRSLHPVARRIVVAVPVAAPGVCDQLRHQAAHVLCLHTPQPFHAVGAFYRNFDQISDAEVRGLLAAAWAAVPEIPDKPEPLSF